MKLLLLTNSLRTRGTGCNRPAFILVLPVLLLLAACSLSSSPTDPTQPPPAGSPNGLNPQETNTVEPGQNPGSAGEAQASNPTPTLVPLPTPDPWDGSRRVTILVMGLDYGDWDSPDRQGPPRTDTMLLLTIDPVTRSAGILSIPRDLYVNVPGFGERKINVAYRFGELYELEGGGPGLARRTVEQFLGVPIDFYAQVDFFAFEEFIDEIGGVEIDIPEEITVDPIGPGNTVTLEPGLQVLDGPIALAYARNRKTAGGDIDRAERQQQVILAIRDQVLRLDMLPRLVLRSPDLYRQLNAGIRTDLSLEQAVELAWLAQQVEPENIERAVIGPNEVTSTRLEDNQAVLIPNPERVRLLIDELFSIDLSLITAEGNRLKRLVQEEAAVIQLVDSTGIEGVALATAEYLRSLGVEGVTDPRVSSSTNESKVVDYTGNPYTLKFLVDTLHINPKYITTEYKPGSEVDLRLILGRDWADDNTLPDGSLP